MDGRAITASDVRGAEMLIVRSVTRVNEALLAGSRVRFVGTATIGTDHVDADWLARQGIEFVSAPGSNAESVAQYIASALTYAAARRGVALSQCSIGIVGVGHCGSRVARVAGALGMNVFLNDPPLARQTGDPCYRPLDELFDCDFLTLHVPLTREGSDPTWHLIDEDAMRRLNPRAILINACRGNVVDDTALQSRLASGQLGGAILDTWASEPAIWPELARLVLLGTPHIAGYSFDGKVAGLRMIYEAACKWLGQTAEPLHLDLPVPSVPQIDIDAGGRSADSILIEIVQAAYSIEQDSARLMAELTGDRQAMAAAFDRLRRDYPIRREFAATTAHLQGGPDGLRKRIEMLGFRVHAC